MSRFIDEDSLKFTNFEIVACEGDFKKAFKLLLDKIDNAPTVDAKPVRYGHWIHRHYINGPDEMFVCSECREEFSYDAETGVSITDYNYCPNCGCKMDEN